MDFNSEQFKAQREHFESMFKQEGNVYSSIKKTIEEQFETVPTQGKFTKLALLTILEDVAVEYIADNSVVVLEEKDFLNGFKAKVSQQ